MKEKTESEKIESEERKIEWKSGKRKKQDNSWEKSKKRSIDIPNEKVKETAFFLIEDFAVHGNAAGQWIERWLRYIIDQKNSMKRLRKSPFNGKLLFECSTLFDEIFFFAFVFVFVLFFLFVCFLFEYSVLNILCVCVFLCGCHIQHTNTHKNTLHSR